MGQRYIQPARPFTLQREAKGGYIFWHVVDSRGGIWYTFDAYNHQKPMHQAIDKINELNLPS